MNNGVKSFAKNVSFTFTSNIISMLISFIYLLVLPKFLGVEDYGYYQLYIFYIQYVAVLCFGWVDGIYLVNGGKDYSLLNKNNFCSQFWYLCLSQFIIYFTIAGVMLALNGPGENTLVYICVCIGALAVNPRFYITFLLQATNRIKEYSVVTVTERIISCALIITLLICGSRNYLTIVVLDLIGKYISLFIGVYFCRDIIFAKVLSLPKVREEIKNTIVPGFKLMLASLCSMLIIGVIRFGIQHHWDVSTFGKVSLTISISSMVMQFINAVAVVLFPALRRTSKDNLVKIYSLFRNMIMPAILGIMVFYYPIAKFIGVWLPQYADSVRYAAILFPMCAFECKTALLINTYYKTLRMEKILMKCNLMSLALSAVCTIISTLVLNSVFISVLSILVVLAFRCVICELILTRKISVSVKKDILLELMLSAVFVLVNWNLGFIGMVIYLFAYMIYVFIKKNDLSESMKLFKEKIKG